MPRVLAKGCQRFANVLGFYIQFKSKTMNHARAYFPILGSVSAYRPLCPIRMLRDVGERGWVVPGFLGTIGKGAPLKEYLQQLIACKTTVSPYELRTGGRT